MIQHINFQTHRSGHTLDLLISRGCDNVIDKVQPSTFLSSHCAVHFTFQTTKSCERFQRKQVSFRKIKSIDNDALRNALRESRIFGKIDQIPNDDINVNSTEDVNTSTNMYNSCLQNIIDDLAPLKTKTFCVRPRVPWIKTELLDAKRERRRLEKQWR